MLIIMVARPNFICVPNISRRLASFSVYIGFYAMF